MDMLTRTNSIGDTITIRPLPQGAGDILTVHEGMLLASIVLSPQLQDELAAWLVEAKAARAAEAASAEGDPDDRQPGDVLVVAHEYRSSTGRAKVDSEWTVRKVARTDGTRAGTVYQVGNRDGQVAYLPSEIFYRN